MSTAYLSLKVLHIAAVISWMAGLLYLPRLFVYHAQFGQDSPQAKTFMVMEHKLMQVIMLPAMLITWASGAALTVLGGFAGAHWFHAKVLLVIGLSALHGYFAVLRKRFVEGKNRHDHRFFRLINEVPAILMLAIVTLVVFKPF